jgi:hypothetical protein
MSQPTASNAFPETIHDVHSSGARGHSDAIQAQIEEHRQNVMSNDPHKNLSSTQHFRRLLSIG